MSRTFTPRSVERLRPFLRDAAHELIDGFADAGRCEFMAAFADVYPSLGLCELIGVPTQDRDRFRGWADTVGLGFSPFVAMHITQVDAALTQLLEYTGELAARRRLAPARRSRQPARRRRPRRRLERPRGAELHRGPRVRGPRDDEEPARLDDRVALGASRRVGRRRHRARSRFPTSSRRCCAIDPPSPASGGRRPRRSRSGDQQLEAGERVFLSSWGANHDERAYPHPEKLDPVQAGVAPHLAFGHGAHFCLGAALARAELQEALAALDGTHRLPDARGRRPLAAADRDQRPGGPADRVRGTVKRSSSGRQARRGCTASSKLLSSTKTCRAPVSMSRKHCCRRLGLRSPALPALR